MSEEYKVTADEMLEALTRSGYLLEAEIAKQLSQSGFFVETNQVIEDPITGKNREIDIIAEYYDFNKPHDKLRACAKIEFVFEVKNNLFPVVLLNEFEFTPRTEDFLGLKEMVTKPNAINYDGYDDYYDPLIKNAKSGIYSQYCSFLKKKKNDDLMALHPENIHSGLSKIIQYCQENVNFWDGLSEEKEEERFFRRFLYMPILLLNDDLYELQNDELVKVESSILVINYHHSSEKHMAYVFVVTKEGFRDFISNALKIERNVEANMKRDLQNV